MQRTRLQRRNACGCSDVSDGTAGRCDVAAMPRRRRGGNAPLRLDDKRVVHHKHVALTRLVPSRSGAHGGTRGVIEAYSQGKGTQGLLEGYSQETLGVLEGYSQGYSRGTDSPELGVLEEEIAQRIERRALLDDLLRRYQPAVSTLECPKTR